MKTLLIKELRENARVALLGLAAFALLIIFTWRNYSHTLDSIARTGIDYGLLRTEFQPLTSGIFLASIALASVALGVSLGGMQVFHERQRDLWAYLVHRPVTRTTIFLSKIISGLLLYSIAAGLPLILFLIWIRVPGHVAAPFEWSMANPLLFIFLCGILSYLAAMLTGLRQARWYASRSVPLGVPLLVSVTIMAGLGTWQIASAILLGALILGTALWGAYQTQGCYQGQPVLGKVSTTIVLVCGVIVVLFVAAGILAALVPGLSSSVTWSHYAMTRDGQVYLQVQGNPQGPQILDLSGKPFSDPTSGKPIELSEFQRRLAPTTLIQLNNDLAPAAEKASSRDYIFLRFSAGTLWYFSQRSGRLLAYNVASRRFVGSIGPDGFARDAHGKGERFQSGAHTANIWQETETLASSLALYRVHLEDHTVEKLFTTAADEPIIASTDLFPTTNQATLVLTRHFAMLLDRKGAVLSQIPYEPLKEQRTTVQLSILDPVGQFALWVSPSSTVVPRDRPLPRTQITWFSTARGVSKRAELPTLTPAPSEGGVAEKVFGLGFPVAVTAFLSSVISAQAVDPFPSHWILWNAAGALCIWSPLGWYRGRRYAMPLQVNIAWAVFHLLFGLPGFLTFLCSYDWPAREQCPVCKKLRLVSREACEHCGAPFPPPPKTGTEIFDTTEPTPSVQLA